MQHILPPPDAPAPPSSTATPKTGEGDRPEGASGKGRNLTLEGLRGFSASVVICYHLHNMAENGGFFHPHHTPWVNSFIKSAGPFGVLLFFMISGYLIVQSLVKYSSIPLFLKHRVWRIYPVFGLLHVVIFTFGPWYNYAWMGALRHSPVQYVLHFLSNFFVLPGIFPLPLAQKNAWSLSYEWAFYLISCLFFFAATGRAPKPMRGLSLAGGLTAAVLVLITHPMAAYFLVGVGLFLWGRAGSRLERVPAAVGLCCLALAFGAWAQGWLLLSLAASVPFFATVVAQTGWFSRLLRTRPLLYLGSISYSLYLIHPFVLDPMRALAAHLAAHLHSDGLAMAVFVVLGAGGSVLAAALLYRGVEVEFTNRVLRGQHRAMASGKITG